MISLGMSPRSTDCEAEALTIKLIEALLINWLKPSLDANLGHSQGVKLLLPVLY